MEYADYTRYREALYCAAQMERTSRLPPYEAPVETRCNGESSIVGIVKEHSNPYVVKSDKDASIENNLFREASILDYLEDEAQTEPPLSIPRMRTVSIAGEYAVLDYLPGKTFRHFELRTMLSSEEKTEWGRQVGEFVAWLGRELPFPGFRRYSFHDTPRRYNIDEVFAERCERSAFPPIVLDCPKLMGIVDDTYQRLLSYRQQGLFEPKLIGHDDIRDENLVADYQAGTWQLTGIIDFGRTHFSTPERELRNLCFIGDGTVQAAAASYTELTGDEVRLDFVQFWARMHTLNYLLNHLEGKLQNDPHELTENLIERISVVLPSYNLAELTERMHIRKNQNSILTTMRAANGS